MAQRRDDGGVQRDLSQAVGGDAFGTDSWDQLTEADVWTLTAHEVRSTPRCTRGISKRVVLPCLQPTRELDRDDNLVSRGRHHPSTQYRPTGIAVRELFTSRRPRKPCSVGLVSPMRRELQAIYLGAKTNQRVPLCRKYRIAAATSILRGSSPGR
jgi:hypothetical protein